MPSRYAPSADSYATPVNFEEPVNDADLRLVWRNTTQSPLETWDEPVYEQFFRRVRAVNWTLPPGQRIRVLLGDPPIDWSTITTRQQVFSFLMQRDSHAASVVEQQVLARGCRALLCYGAAHLFHANGPGPLVPLIQQQTRVRTYVIADVIPLEGDPGGLGAKLAGYPVLGRASAPRRPFQQHRRPEHLPAASTARLPAATSERMLNGGPRDARYPGSMRRAREAD